MKKYEIRVNRYAPELTKLSINGFDVDLKTEQRQALFQWYFAPHKQGDLIRYIRKNIFAQTTKFVKFVAITKTHSLSRLQEINVNPTKSGIFTDYKQILATKKPKENGILNLYNGIDENGKVIYKEFLNSVSYSYSFKSLYI